MFFSPFFHDFFAQVATELTPVSQRATHALHIGDFEAANALLDTARSLLGSLVDAEPPQRWNIRGYGQAANAVEAFVTAECLRGVLTTGKLLGRAEFSMLEDSEYVGTIFYGTTIHACMHAFRSSTSTDLFLAAIAYEEGMIPCEQLFFRSLHVFSVSCLLIEGSCTRCCDLVWERSRCGQHTECLHGKRDGI